MDETMKWVDETVANLLKEANYEDQAVIKAARAALHEQAKRLENAEGELDGRIWSKEAW